MKTLYKKTSTMFIAAVLMAVGFSGCENATKTTPQATNTEITNANVADANTNTTNQAVSNTNTTEPEETVTEEDTTVEVTESTSSADAVGGQPETADWETFTNNNYKYEIKYPVESIYENENYAGNIEENKMTQISSNTYDTDIKQADSVCIGWGPSSFFKIDILVKSSQDSIMDFIDKEIDISNPNVTLTSDDIKNTGKEITLNGIKGYEFSSGECCITSHGLNEGQIRYVYLNYSDEKIIKISYPETNDTDSHYKEHKAIFDQMLNTFTLK